MTDPGTKGFDDAAGIDRQLQTYYARPARRPPMVTDERERLAAWLNDYADGIYATPANGNLRAIAALLRSSHARLVGAYKDYIALLEAELSDLAGYLHVHGIQSTRAEAGKAARAAIAAAEAQPAQDADDELIIGEPDKFEIPFVKDAAAAERARIQKALLSAVQDEQEDSDLCSLIRRICAPAPETPAEEESDG